MARPPNTNPDIDLYRLQVATHELGHLVAWERLPGARIVAVRVYGRGVNTEGHVEVDWPTAAPELDHGYLVGLLAGREADRIFTNHHPDFPYSDRGAAHDLNLLRRIRRNHTPSRQWTEHRLRTDAARLVRAHWDRIQRLAPYLARRGHLNL
jgi:hypothetical protein